MKLLGLTQHVMIQPNGRYDSLDQRFWPFIQQLGYIPVPLPNLPVNELPTLVNTLSLSAILLTGGNSLAKYATSEAAPERDAFEIALIEWAMHKHCPIVGICRGLQIINDFFGGTLAPISHPIGEYHTIHFCHTLAKKSSRQVKSYHHWGVFESNLATPLRCLATHEDGSIEAFEHPEEKIAAMMWHPERETPFDKEDIILLREWLT